MNKYPKNAFNVDNFIVFKKKPFPSLNVSRKKPLKLFHGKVK